MAIWQCSFTIVPSRDSERAGRCSESRTGTESEWDGTVAPEQLWIVANTVLGRGASWDEDLWLWGDEEGTCLEAFWQHGLLKELSLRVDVRSPDQRALPPLIEAIRGASLRLVDSEGRWVAADSAGVAAAIRSSPAWRFVESPGKFLNSLSASWRHNN